MPCEVPWSFNTRSDVTNNLTTLYELPVSIADGCYEEENRMFGQRPRARFSRLNWRILHIVHTYIHTEWERKRVEEIHRPFRNFIVDTPSVACKSRKMQFPESAVPVADPIIQNWHPRSQRHRTTSPFTTKQTSLNPNNKACRHIRINQVCGPSCSEYHQT